MKDVNVTIDITVIALFDRISTTEKPKDIVLLTKAIKDLAEVKVLYNNYKRNK